MEGFHPRGYNYSGKKTHYTRADKEFKSLWYSSTDPASLTATSTGALLLQRTKHCVHGEIHGWRYVEVCLTSQLESKSLIHAYLSLLFRFV